MRSKAQHTWTEWLLCGPRGVPVPTCGRKKERSKCWTRCKSVKRVIQQRVPRARGWQKQRERARRDPSTAPATAGSSGMAVLRPAGRSGGFQTGERSASGAQLRSCQPGPCTALCEAECQAWPQVATVAASGRGLTKDAGAPSGQGKGGTKGSPSAEGGGWLQEGAALVLQTSFVLRPADRDAVGDSDGHGEPAGDDRGL